MQGVAEAPQVLQRSKEIGQSWVTVRAWGQLHAVICAATSALRCLRVPPGNEVGALGVPLADSAQALDVQGLYPLGGLHRARHQQAHCWAAGRR